MRSSNYDWIDKAIYVIWAACLIALGGAVITIVHFIRKFW